MLLIVLMAIGTDTRRQIMAWFLVAAILSSVLPPECDHLEGTREYFAGELRALGPMAVPERWGLTLFAAAHILDLHPLHLLVPQAGCRLGVCVSGDDLDVLVVDVGATHDPVGNEFQNRGARAASQIPSARLPMFFVPFLAAFAVVSG